MVAYAEPGECDKILQKLEFYKEWLYGEGKGTTKSNYQGKLDELKGLC